MTTHIPGMAPGSGSAVDGGATPLPPAGTYRIDPAASRLAFTTRHLFGVGAVRGAFTTTGGRITVPGRGPAADVVGAEERFAVSVSVAAASVDTGSPARDRGVRSARMLDTGAYPDVTFTADQVLPDRSGWRVTGQLTAHGTVAPVELSVDDLTGDDAGLTVHARARIDRYAHGLTAMKGLAARHVDVDITARAHRA